MVRTLVRSPSRRRSKSRRRMTPGSTRKQLSFNNSQRRSRSRRVSTLRKSPSFKQSNRKRSFGSTKKTLRFSKRRSRNNKSRKRPNLGPPRRIKRKTPKKSRSPWKKY